MNTDAPMNIQLAHIPRGKLTQKQARAIFAREYGKTHDLYAIRKDEKPVVVKRATKDQKEVKEVRPVWAAMLIEKTALEDDPVLDDAEVMDEELPETDTEDEGSDDDLIDTAMDLLDQLQDTISQLDDEGDEEMLDDVDMESPATLEDIPPKMPFSSVRPKEAGLTKAAAIREARELTRTHPEYKGYKLSRIDEKKNKFIAFFTPLGE